MKETTFALIPARMQSHRFPGKPLADLVGRPMVVHCARNAEAAGLETWVCSDSLDIIDVCNKYGIKVIHTGPFQTGTDRCTWAAEQLGAKQMVILQGDEPLIGEQSLRLFAAALDGCAVTGAILNGLAPLTPTAAQDTGNVKAVLLRSGRICFLSRIPVVSETAMFGSTASSSSRTLHLKQLGLYGGELSSFKAFQALGSCALENTESIEMMRWLAADLPLQGMVLKTTAISVDTPADLDAAREALMRSPTNNAGC